MRTETLVLFSDEEEEFVHLLIGIGIKKNIAKVLVFLAKHPSTTSRAIERGTDMSQPEVSVVMKILLGHGWIASRESPAESRGRPVNIYRLAKSIPAIMDGIEKEKRVEAACQLSTIRKLRTFI